MSPCWFVASLTPISIHLFRFRPVVGWLMCVCVWTKFIRNHKIQFFQTTFPRSTHRCTTCNQIHQPYNHVHIHPYDFV
jgi:hypothetical protein